MLHRAVQETGQHERDGSALSSRLAAYAQAGGLALPDVGGAIPYWGGAFLAWVAIRDGLVPPANPADPESWRDWGHPLAEPLAGCVVVLTGGGGAARTLVGVVARVGQGRVYVVGPHDGVIEMRCYDIDRVIEARRPPTVTLSAAVATAPQAAQPVEVRVVVETGQPAGENASAGRSASSGPTIINRAAIDVEPVVAHETDIDDREPDRSASVPSVRTAPLPPVDLDALKMKALRDIAANADRIRQAKPVAEHLRFVGSVAVLAADVVHAAPDPAAIEAAKRHVIGALAAL